MVLPRAPSRRRHINKARYRVHREVDAGRRLNLSRAFRIVSFANPHRSKGFALLIR